MDEERSWQRITDVARKCAQAYGVPMPEALERVEGNAWERDRQRRAALETFAEKVDDFPRFTIDAAAEQIADALDEYWLITSEVSESEE